MLRVVDLGDLSVTQLVFESSLGNYVTPLPINGVPEARMVHLLNAVTLAEYLVADLIKVLYARREPWHLR